MKSIFVSSTFQDFNRERDVLRNYVQPKLNAIAKQYGESVSFCDLRWGIDTTNESVQENEDKILTVCLDQIDRSRPYMLILIGERYGYMPGPDKIEREAKRRPSLTLEDLDISITHLEIEYGALNNKDDVEHVFCYIRLGNTQDPLWYEDIVHMNKLNHLKERLERIFGDQIRYYEVNPDSDLPLQAFAEDVVENLSQRLKLEWEQYSKLSASELNSLIQWNHLYEKKKVLEVNRDYGDAIADVILNLQEINKSIMIKGPTGSGKSTLFSYICDVVDKNGWKVIPYFCGSTPMTTDAAMLFNDIDQISVSDTDKVLIAIDGIDQIVLNKEKLPGLLIEQTEDVPIRFLYTATDDFTADENMDNYWMPTTNILSKKQLLQKILEQQGKELSGNVIEAILAKKASDNPLYLYFMVSRLCIMNEGDYQEINKIGTGMEAICEHQISLIHSLPGNLEDISYALIKEAAYRIDGHALLRSCEYLAASRYGLRLSDLEALLNNDGIHFVMLHFAQFVHYMEEMFILRSDGRYDFLHKCIREGFRKFCEDIRSIHRKIAVYMLTLSDENIVYSTSNDMYDDQSSKDFELRKREVSWHLIESNDIHLFFDYLNGYFDEDSFDFLIDECCVKIQEDDGYWILKCAEYAAQNHTKKVSLSMIDIISGIIVRIDDKLIVKDTALIEKLGNIALEMLKIHIEDSMQTINSHWDDMKVVLNTFNIMRSYYKKTEYLLDSLGDWMRKRGINDSAVRYYKQKVQILLSDRRSIEEMDSRYTIANKDVLMRSVNHKIENTNSTLKSFRSYTS